MGAVEKAIEEMRKNEAARQKQPASSGYDSPYGKRWGEHTNTINNAFQEVLGRQPSASEFNKYMRDIQGSQITSPAQLKILLMQLKPSSSGGGGGGGRGMSDYLSRIEQIAASPLASKEATYDNTALEAERSKVRTYIDDIRSGKIQPEITAPSLRANLIDQAKQTYSRELGASEEALMQQLNQRGLMPSSSTGYSGLATQNLAENRAKVYEDPLTSFIRDFDIQQEMERVSRQQQLNDIATQLQTGMITSAQAEAEIKAQLAMNNINSQRQYTSGVFGNILQNEAQMADMAMREKLGMGQLSLQEKEFYLKQDQYREALEAADKSNDGAIWGTLGTIGGAIAGSYGGPAGAMAGANIGGQIGNSLGGGSSNANGLTNLMNAYNLYSGFSSSKPSFGGGFAGTSSGASGSYPGYQTTGLNTTNYIVRPNYTSNLDNAFTKFASNNPDYNWAGGGYVIR
jgi:hypothetical protein